MIDIFKGRHFTDGAKLAKFQPHPLLQIVIFGALLLIFLIAQTIVQIPFSAVMLAAGASDEWYNAISLFSTCVPAGLAIVYCTKIEKRSIESMGIKRVDFVKNYLFGMTAGFGAFSLSLLICVIAGASEFSGTNFNGNIPYIIVMFFGWAVQGAEEEILCRGWLMPSLSQRLPLWAAVIGNAAVFSLLHLFNDGFSIIAFLNILFVGIAFSLIAVKTDSIIACCAFHSVWNAVQGNFYGLPVSGGVLDKSVFIFTLSESKDIFTGGVFGIEGGIGVTVVIVSIIAVCLLLPEKNKEEDHND